MLHSMPMSPEWRWGHHVRMLSVLRGGQSPEATQQTNERVSIACSPTCSRKSTLQLPGRGCVCLRLSMGNGWAWGLPGCLDRNMVELLTMQPSPHSLLLPVCLSSRPM